MAQSLFCAWAPFFLLPASLAADRLLGEPPASVHPVCAMGALAVRAEKFFRRLFSCPVREEPSEGPASPAGAGVRLRERLAGTLAACSVILPFSAAAWAACAAAEQLHAAAGAIAACAAVWLCLAPRSLAEHALRVAEPLERGREEDARAAVSMIVGRRTQELDRAGIARACVESVAENMTDGVLATLFWAAAGGMLAGWGGAAALAFAHRACNTLDAMWGKRNARYGHFGTAAARLDDVLGLAPARLSLPAAALACLTVPGCRAADAAACGWKWRRAHESPNSAWSEAAFAGALGLRLGGPAVYGSLRVAHPWLGNGTPEAGPEHIRAAVALMLRTSLLFAAACGTVWAAACQAACQAAC